MYAIETEHLTKQFRQRVVVDDLNVQVQMGEVFGFLGPNGAGKTTTISLLLALLKPTSGTARIMGHDVQQHPIAALRYVGAMLETPAFYPYLSGRDNLRVLALAEAIPMQRVATVLDMVELTNRATDRVKTYSQGMKQRLAIAAALLHQPRVIILDEPTNGLDPAGTVEIRELINQLAQQQHTIFLCSHLLHEVEQVCQRVAIVKAGRIIVQGSVAELLNTGHVIQLTLATNQHLQQTLTVLQHIEWIDSIEHMAHAGNVIRVAVDDVQRAAELNKLLAHHDILVAEIRTHQQSLEAFFLETTAEAS